VERGHVTLLLRLLLVASGIAGTNVVATPGLSRLIASQSTGVCNPLRQVYEMYADAVVRVSGVRTRDDGTDGLRTGSGFFVREDGCLVTTAGIVEGASEIIVECGSGSYYAEVIGVDCATNIAVLRLRGNGGGSFPNFSLGNDENLPVATTQLLGITCEIGFDPSPCLGIICGQNISCGTHNFPTTYLRSSLPSNAGAPGSPIFDLDGNFVGVLMASISQTNGSFLLPARAMRRILCDILVCGSVRHAYVGVDAQLVRGELGECVVRVERVEPESPAAASNLIPGDHIVSINGHSIGTMADLYDTLFFAQPNMPMNLRLLRDGEIVQVIIRTICREK
jgi:serine protease Do